jgi:DNA-binding FadR family transcriptional regulator
VAGCGAPKTKTLIRTPKKLTPLSPPARRSGQDNIVAVLGAEILSGARKPGDRMPSDTDMLRIFGVSRVVTREVIKTLAAKGMVASKMKVGTIVLPPASWNWLDPDVLSWRVTNGLDLNFLAHVTDIRRAVEPVAASLAAVHRTRADIVKLREAIAAMSRAKEDRRLFAEADLRFHLAVSIASRNPFFQSFAGIIETALSSMLSINALADDSRMQSHTVATHAAVVDAIEAGDSEKAGTAMLRTVQDGFAHAKRARRQRYL